MPKQETEKSAFLLQQEKRMAAIAEQDHSIEERQKYTLQPAVNEKQPDNSGNVIETYNRETDKVTFRTVQPLPTPQRIQPAKPLAKAELLDMIAELREEMATQQERFDNKDAIDRERTARKNELHDKVNALHEQLTAAQAELNQLKSEGSVRDGFIAFAAQAENKVTQIATGAYGHLLERYSQEAHEAPFAELTNLLKETVRFKVDRTAVKVYTLPHFARLHATPKDQVTNARIEATLEKVFTATEKIEKSLE